MALEEVQDGKGYWSFAVCCVIVCCWLFSACCNPARQGYCNTPSQGFLHPLACYCCPLWLGALALTVGLWAAEIVTAYVPGAAFFVWVISVGIAWGINGPEMSELIATERHADGSVTDVFASGRKRERPPRLRDKGGGERSDTTTEFCPAPRVQTIRAA